MKFVETRLPGVIIVEPGVHRDAHGYFWETFHTQKYAEGGITAVHICWPVETPILSEKDLAGQYLQDLMDQLPRFEGPER